MKLQDLFEAKNHLGDTEYTTYKSWKAAIKKAANGKPIKFTGDVDIDEAHVDGHAIGEWGGDTGSVYKKDITEAFSPAVVARRAVFKTAVDAIRAAGGKISHGAGKTMFKSEVDRLAALRGDEAPDRTKLAAAKAAVKALLTHKAE